MDRPSWDTYFLNIAKLVSTRSNDAQTKHGCVIINKDRQIIGTGYNSFPRGMNDSSLPNIRPDKYDYIVHSEINALLNCVIKPKDCTAFVTGQCCNHCIFCMWNAGITEVVMANQHGSYLIDDKQKKIFELFINQTGLRIRYVDCKFDLIKINPEQCEKLTTHNIDIISRKCNYCGRSLKKIQNDNQ